MVPLAASGLFMTSAGQTCDIIYLYRIVLTFHDRQIQILAVSPFCHPNVILTELIPTQHGIYFGGKASVP